MTDYRMQRWGKMPAMVEIVWEFIALADRVAEFEATYGPSGRWAGLFSGSPEYRGTTLARAVDGDPRYLCVDAWTNAAAFERWKAANRAAYNALDRECEALTARETYVGTFELMQ